jgi:hypothetical protein
LCIPPSVLKIGLIIATLSWHYNLAQAPAFQAGLRSLMK